jgi:REP element-mobilizing transposase RayT
MGNSLEDRAVKQYRRSIRLKGYDYRQAGAYFVTICVRNRLCLFGEVVNGAIKINDAGRLVQSAWGEIPVRFSNLQIDEFIVMPNHIHGILIVGAQFIAPSSVRHDRRNAKQGAINHAPTLGEIVRSFKAASTRAWFGGRFDPILRGNAITTNMSFATTNLFIAFATIFRTTSVAGISIMKTLRQ